MNMSPDPYSSTEYRWWHLSEASPELLGALADGWISLAAPVIDLPLRNAYFRFLLDRGCFHYLAAEDRLVRGGGAARPHPWRSASAAGLLESCRKKERHRRERGPSDVCALADRSDRSRMDSERHAKDGGPDRTPGTGGHDGSRLICGTPSDTRP